MKRFSTQLIKRNGERIMLIIILPLVIFILVSLGLLFTMSRGVPEPFRDKNGNLLVGSISEKTFININGIRQGMFIKSKDVSKPVLLYLHGGIPDYFLSTKYQSGLEDLFTVVWWEQRGSGLSFSNDLPIDSLTLEQFVSDTKEVTKYLCKRFDKEKIYLMGRSGGTFIGIHVAALYPELYHAYIGVAQISNQLKSEILAYEFMLKKYKENKNHKMLKKLESAPVNMKIGTTDKYLSIRDEAMHSIGIGTTRKMNSIIRGIFLPSLMCKDYTLIEKINFWRGKSKSGVSYLWKTILATDLSTQITDIKIPVYFFHGIYDYTVSYPLAKDYFEKLNAPIKEFYTFEHSAHSPYFEEPEKIKQIFQSEILNPKIKFSEKH